MLIITIVASVRRSDYGGVDVVSVVLATPAIDAPTPPARSSHLVSAARPLHAHHVPWTPASVVAMVCAALVCLGTWGG
eukprot:162337-Prorocentrum_minimum.AAC.1